ncbi:lanthionine synthetase C family protein [Actinomadura meridiana]|uniref:Lanthionine synthetase C family protein n=1 Tax=Actinomadura meridiana TaxID=559626 RepID=A0ABP8BSR1_9ACTN
MFPPAQATEPGQSLARGAAGIALLHVERVHDRIGHWDTVHAWVKAATHDEVTAGDTAGLFFGAPAIAYLLTVAGQPAYGPVLRDLDGHIEALVRERLGLARDRIDRGCLPALSEFDLISGLTGFGAYLLLRGQGGDLLADVLGYLVRLTGPLKIGDIEVPGWWSANGLSDEESPDWPDGHGNFGMAHGIGGPLAFLSAAMMSGVSVSGQPEAVARICSALDRAQAGGDHWPGVVSLTDWTSGAPTGRTAERPSWCYGTPGIARAQQLAGIALDDQGRKRTAEQLLYECVTDERQLALLSDTSICHGWAGLLQVVWRTAKDADDSRLAGQLPRLIDGMDRRLNADPPGHCGLLEGAAGVELVRHTLARGTSRPLPWDACLLLDGGPKAAPHVVMNRQERDR